MAAILSGDRRPAATPDPAARPGRPGGEPAPGRVSGDRSRLWHRARYPAAARRRLARPRDRSGAGGAPTLEERTPPAWRPRLTTRLARLEATSLPAAELVNASFSLIFAARPPLLADHLRCIHAALVPGGRFAGQLLGPRDSWVETGQAVGSDRCQLAHLLAGFELERLVMEETDAVTPKGEAKHWHIWHINARKAAFRNSSRRS
ncbi:MAG: hypothetical protein R3D28_00080 [Geminicoccaceae bacterium]